MNHTKIRVMSVIGGWLVPFSRFLLLFFRLVIQDTVVGTL